MNYENFIGRKIKGFKFELTEKLNYLKSMDQYVGVVGDIIGVDQYGVNVVFPDGGVRAYPANQIEKHLISETPIIPQLGKGVLMEVSHYSNFKISKQIPIFGEAPGGGYIGWEVDDGGEVIIYGVEYWPYARPIQETPIKEYTLEELKAIVGHDFKIK